MKKRETKLIALTHLHAFNALMNMLIAALKKIKIKNKQKFRS